MTAIVLRRIGWSVLVVWFVVTATFALVAVAPGSPVHAMVGPHASQRTKDLVSAQYCVDEGLVTRYGCWLATLGDGLGTSFRTERKVTDILGDRVWPTVQLALAAIVLQLLIGIPLGVVSAVRRGRWPDRLASGFTVLAQSAPAFFVATVLVYLLAFRFELFPLGGYGDGFWDRLHHLVLPALTLATLGVAYYARVIRSELGDTLGQDYVRTARAKGLPERTVVWRHALRPALPPLVTVIGLDLGMLVGGAVVIEQIFSWPGLGREMLQAILDVDMPVILGIVLVTAVAIAIANLAVDLVQLWLDPRLRE
ncbi:MAG TPA: ABC transporter permease [Kofleriaceae bacterium]|nr:ABC transporter permease [Kofleriaceae bacterium]